MANRFPLVINNSTTVVGELQSGDSLNLSLSGIYDGTGTGLAGQFLKANGNGTVSWGVPGDVFLSATQSIQNKTFTSCTINGGSNTLTNISNSSLVNSNITINGSVISLGGSVTTPDNNYTYSLVTTSPGTNVALIRLQGSNGGSTTEFNIFGENGIVVTRETTTNIKIETSLSSLIAGTYLTGTSYNGLTSQTWSVDATSTNTASKVVARDSNGDFAGRIITATTFARVSGTSSQFLKGDGSVDTNVYLTSESDTLSTVTARGSSTTQNITAASFIKSGGTSSQFLKADGSVDSNTYVTETFASGTTLPFYQAAAPTGWTKNTTHNNKALRVVSGTGGGSGGTSAFTTVFASRTPSGSVSGSNSGGGVSGHTLSTNEIPSHTHSCNWYNTGSEASGRGAPPTGDFQNRVLVTAGPSFNTNSTGGSNSHSHGFSNPSWSGSFTGTAMDFAVQYIDIIICSKN